MRKLVQPFLLAAARLKAAAACMDLHARMHAAWTGEEQDSIGLARPITSKWSDCEK